MLWENIKKLDEHNTEDQLKISLIGINSGLLQGGGGLDLEYRGPLK